MGGDAPAGPNRVANDWLRARVGKFIRIVFGDLDMTAELVRWDSYALLLRAKEGCGHGREILVLKAPGMRFYDPQ